MVKTLKKYSIFCFLLVIIICCSAATGNAATTETSPFPGKITLSTDKSTVGALVHYTIKGLKPNTETKLEWSTVKGKYVLNGLYAFTGASFEDKVVPLKTDKSDANGNLEGDFTVPSGYGGNHTLYVEQADRLMTQANVKVTPTFKISPSSGPVGTEITITAEGIGYSEIERTWDVSYDNKYTGMITAVTTDGKATAKIRASGPVGKHTVIIWPEYLGAPYMNPEQSPYKSSRVPPMTFDVTDGNIDKNQYVEAIPTAADGGVIMPKLKKVQGVAVSLDKDSGVVGDTITMKASGLPKYKKVKVLWNTMRGSRVSGNGFGEVQEDLFNITTNSQGAFTVAFPVPDDLGGIPHRIDVTVDGKIYGQAYLSITPSIVNVSPASGPAGTPFQIELKGVGWTEYDNTYYITYDNAYVGYVCGFNSEGTVIVNMNASGEPGYHIIDIYPGIYKGEQQKPNIYLLPQLTYSEDHPGSAIPAIRLGFEVTNP